MSVTIPVTVPRRAEPRPSELAGLARFEGRKLLRHPLFLGFAALTALFVAIFLGDTADDPTGTWYWMLGGGPVQFIPLAAGVLIAANMAASRSRHDRTDDFYASMPNGPSSRVMAQIGGVAWPTALTAGLIGVGIAITQAWSGLPVALETDPGPESVDYPIGSIAATDVTPSLGELAQSPLAVAVFGVVGVALAVWIRSRLILVVLPVLVIAHLIVTSWAVEKPWRWFLPFVTSDQGVGWVESSSGEMSYSVVRGFNVAAVAWHDLYLVGLVVLLSGLALLRFERSPRVVAALASGVVVATVGGIMQVATYTPSL